MLIEVSEMAQEKRIQSTGDLQKSFTHTNPDPVSGPPVTRQPPAAGGSEAPSRPPPHGSSA